MGRKVVRVEDLDVWRRAHQLVLKIYEGTRDFPQEEKFTLVSQMRRSAISIPANVAEGFRRNGLRDKVNFYNIAQSSLDELRYYVVLSRHLGYISDISEIVHMIDEVGALLGGLVKATRARTQKPEARSPGKKPGIRSQNPGVRSPEPGKKPEARSQKPGAGQEARSQKSEARSPKPVRRGVSEE